MGRRRAGPCVLRRARSRSLAQDEVGPGPLSSLACAQRARSGAPAPGSLRRLAAAPKMPGMPAEADFPKGTPMNETMSLAERMDALEFEKMRQLDVIIAKSALFTMADGIGQEGVGNVLLKRYPGKYMLMGDDPRLPKMPERP